jgi:hypothetical protein
MSENIASRGLSLRLPTHGLDPRAVIAAPPSLKQLLRADAACIGVEPRLSHQLSLLSLALRPVHLADRVGLSAGWSFDEHRCAFGLSDQCPGDRRGEDSYRKSSSSAREVDRFMLLPRPALCGERSGESLFCTSALAFSLPPRRKTHCPGVGFFPSRVTENAPSSTVSQCRNSAPSNRAGSWPRAPDRHRSMATIRDSGSVVANA